MGFFRQEYWSGLPLLPLLQGIFPTQEWNPCLLHYWQVDSLPSEPPGKPSNYIELVHSAFQIYSIFLLFYLLILFIFEFDIETPTKSLIYLLKRVIAIENPPANAGDTC